MSKSTVFSKMIDHLSNFLVVTVSQMLKECVYCLLHFCGEARGKEQVIHVTLFLCIILRLHRKRHARQSLVIGYGLGNMKNIGAPIAPPIPKFCSNDTERNRYSNIQTVW